MEFGRNPPCILLVRVVPVGTFQVGRTARRVVQGLVQHDRLQATAVAVEGVSVEMDAIIREQAAAHVPCEPADRTALPASSRWIPTEIRFLSIKHV